MNSQREEIKPKFLDIVENGYASKENPHRIGVVVKTGYRTGRMNPGKYYVLTDTLEDFWEVPASSDKLKVVDGSCLRQVRIILATKRGKIEKS
jgi:hypothetical protein